MIIEADLHTHTIASGHAYSTITENARAAHKKGLKMIAVTDHGPAMPGAPHIYYFKNIMVLPRVIEGVGILRGCEANIINTNGDLDMPESILDRLDIVLAGFHKKVFPDNLTAAENTKAMINAMKNPRLDMIVHPGNPLFPVNIGDIVEACVKYGKIIEINNSSLTMTRIGSNKSCRLLAKYLAEAKFNVMLGSDAHFSTFVGELSEAIHLAQEAGLQDWQILNTSTERICRYLNLDVNLYQDGDGSNVE